MASGLGDQLVAAELAEVVSGLAGGVAGVAVDGVDLGREVGDAEPSPSVSTSGEAANATTAARGVRGWSRLMPPTRVAPMVDGWARSSRIPSETKAT